MVSQRDSAEQHQQPAADSAVPSGSSQDSGAEPEAKVGDGAIPKMEPSAAHAGDEAGGATGDARTQRGVQCHGLLPAGGRDIPNTPPPPSPSLHLLSHPLTTLPHPPDRPTFPSPSLAPPPLLPPWPPYQEW